MTSSVESVPCFFDPRKDCPPECGIRNISAGLYQGVAEKRGMTIGELTTMIRGNVHRTEFEDLLARQAKIGEARGISKFCSSNS